jgi:hypothetical protein
VPRTTLSRSPPAAGFITREWGLHLPVELAKVHVERRTVFNALAVDLSQPIPT